MRHADFPPCKRQRTTTQLRPKSTWKLLLDRHNVPDPAFAVAMRRIGRVVKQGINGAAAIGPLHLAAIAPDGGPFSQRLGVGRSQNWWVGAVAAFIAEEIGRASCR